MLWLGIGILGCIGIAWEDIKNRQVHIWWYGILLIGLFGRGILEHSVEELPQMILLNLAFVFLLLILITIYFSIKKKQVVYLFDTYLGWGDVLFFMVLTVYVDLETYIVFTIVSLLVAILFSPIFFYLQGKSKHIPLAGVQAICLIAVLLMKYLNIFPEMMLKVIK